MKKVIILLLILIVSSGVVIEAKELTGKEIIQRVDRTMKAERKYMKEEMILYTASGAKRVRKIEIWNDRSGEKDKMLVKFLSPASIEGTGFLMSGDDMWLYLPALGREKRIAGSARNGSFMGSDLTYEDMETLGSKGFSGDYRAEFITETSLADRNVYQLLLTPITDDLPYSRLKVWIDQKTYLPVKIVYYDDDGSEVKMLKTFSYQKIGGKWTAGRMEMTDLVKGSKTVLTAEEIKFNPDINEQIFSIRNLRRGN